MPKPMYKHDCKSCVFLETVTLNTPYNGRTKFDLYICPSKDGFPSYLARYDNDGPQYLSMCREGMHDELHFQVGNSTGKPDSELFGHGELSFLMAQRAHDYHKKNKEYFCLNEREKLYSK